MINSKWIHSFELQILEFVYIKKILIKEYVEFFFCENLQSKQGLVFINDERYSVTENVNSES